MKQSTSFAQVATNLLNVLQGYTKGIRFVAVLTMLLTVGIGQAWGAEDNDTYDFKTNGITRNSGPTSGNMTSSSDNVVFVSKTGNTTDPWTIVFTGSTYYGYGKGTGIQFGSSNYAPVGQMYSKSYENVSKVEIITSTTNASVNLSVSVGSTSFGQKKVTTGTTISHIYSGTLTTGAVTLTLTSSTKTNFRIEKIIITTEDTPTPIQLEKPTNLKVSNVTTTSATLSWDAVTNASSYTVTVGSTPHSANTNFISLNDLTPSTTYKWSVVAKGNGSTYTDSESAKGSDFTTDTPKKYTVTWMVDKEKLSTEDVYEDGKVSTVPTVTELPCGDKFVGWTTDPITTPQDNAPTVFTTVAGSPKITGDITFYAVFADYK